MTLRAHVLFALLLPLPLFAQERAIPQVARQGSTPAATPTLSAERMAADLLAQSPLLVTRGPAHPPAPSVPLSSPVTLTPRLPRAEVGTGEPLRLLATSVDYLGGVFTLGQPGKVGDYVGSFVTLLATLPPADYIVRFDLVSLEKAYPVIRSASNPKNHQFQCFMEQGTTASCSGLLTVEAPAGGVGVLEVRLDSFNTSLFSVRSVTIVRSPL